MKNLIIAATSIMFAGVLFISAPQAHAESPDILAGQNLTVGSSGQGVVVLQGLLSELGFLNVPLGIPLGYYGSMTKDAVAKYQANLNVAPEAGYFGPQTKLAMYSDFASHGYLRLLNW